MKFRELHEWYSDCNRVHIKREGKPRPGKRVFEVYTRSYAAGGWFFNGRRATLAEAKKLGKEVIKQLESVAA